MKKRTFQFVALLMTAIFVIGCSTDYDCSTDYVQIGCRVRHQAKGRTPPENSCLRFGFPWWIDDSENNTLSGVDLSPFIVDKGKLNGLGISLISLRGNTGNGVIVAPILSVQKKTNGVSFSLINFSMEYCPGIQVGLANFNVAFLQPSGGTAAQLALLNVADDAAVQLGAINVCSKGKKAKEKKNMCQIGLINSSPNCMIQLGLLNRNENACLFRWFPIFNFAGLH